MKWLHHKITFWPDYWTKETTTKSVRQVKLTWGFSWKYVKQGLMLHTIITSAPQMTAQVSQLDKKKNNQGVDV